MSKWWDISNANAQMAFLFADALFLFTDALHPHVTFVSDMLPPSIGGIETIISCLELS